MTGPRVQRHRRVTTRGKRVPQPRAQRPPARRPKYRKSAALGGLSGMFGALFLATGQIFWAVGVVASSSGAAAAAYIDYRRDLIKVKATGKPIEDPKAKPRSRAGGPLQPGDPKPVDLDALTRPRQTRARKPVDEHLARCKANPPGGPTCRCPDGPNRKGKPKTATKRASGARKTGTTK